MPGSPPEFIAQVNQWVSNTKKKNLAVVIGTIQELNTEIIYRWPVKSGFSLSCWTATIGSPSLRSERRKAKDRKGGANPLGRINQIAASLKPGQRYYLVNTAPYARRIEEGFVGTDSAGRTFNQMGRYIVRGVMLNAPRIANNVIQRIAALSLGAVR